MYYRTTTANLKHSYLVDGERAAGAARPNVLLVVVVLAVHLDFVGDKVGGAESHTEMSDHTDVSSGRQGFHERFGSGLGDCS